MAENDDTIPIPQNMFIPPIELLNAMFQQVVQIAQQPDLWHPDRLGVQASSYGPTCLRRVTSDIRVLLDNPENIQGADVFPNDDDATKVEFLIRGQAGTPYAGGFFHFTIRTPPEYPQKPPRACLRTTGGGRVRFNPNYYENGCVCLSILGTYPGEPWNEEFTLTNVLHSLQYQFNQLPWINEPGFFQNFPTEFKLLYNYYLEHETLRVAVCDQLDPKTSHLPIAMRQRAARYFISNYESYVTRCAELSAQLDGKPMMNPYRPAERNTPFQFALIHKRLVALRESAQRDADAGVADEATVKEDDQRDGQGV